MAGITWPIWEKGDLPEFLYVLQENGEEIFNNYRVAALGDDDLIRGAFIRE
jgi:hypothetical protein